MGKYVQIGTTAEFKDGTRKKVTVEGQEIMIARVGDDYYAVASRCAHMGGDLSAGTMDGIIVTCPRHGSQFDIRTGQNLRWMRGSGIAAAVGKAIKSPRDIATYKTKVEGNKISVEI
jgi:3-phenylpropionate/trans-cinnamate dioxygenase ferredoxin component